MLSNKGLEKTAEEDFFHDGGKDDDGEDSEEEIERMAKGHFQKIDSELFRHDLDMKNLGDDPIEYLIDKDHEWK